MKTLSLPKTINLPPVPRQVKVNKNSWPNRSLITSTLVALGFMLVVFAWTYFSGRIWFHPLYYVAGCVLLGIVFMGIRWVGLDLPIKKVVQLGQAVNAHYQGTRKNHRGLGGKFVRVLYTVGGSNVLAETIHPISDMLNLESGELVTVILDPTDSKRCVLYADSPYSVVGASDVAT